MILLVGGTSEAVDIGRALDRAGRPYIMTVATGYGYREATGRVNGRVLKGPFDSAAFARLLNEHPVSVVVDASHPFAMELRHEVAQAAEAAGTKLLRLERPSYPDNDNSAVTYFTTAEELGAWARAENFQKIFVSSGVKSLQVLTGCLEVENMYVRLLPAVESISTALSLGIKSSHIIAAVGPFDRSFNEALFRQLEIDLLITKDSGEAGGFNAKVETALACGCRVAVLKRPAPARGEVYRDTRSLLQSLGIDEDAGGRPHVLLLGHGSKLNTANRGLERLADEIQRRGQFSGVTPTFLQLAHPSLEDAFQMLADKGVCRVVIMPLFLFEGVHMTADIPAAIDRLRSKYPHLQVTLASCIGPDPMLAIICMRKISEALKKDN